VDLENRIYRAKNLLGKEVTWVSQAGGHIKRKTGRVIVAVGRSEGGFAMQILDAAKTKVTRSQLKADGYLDPGRVIVEVTRTGRLGRKLQSHYYAPSVGKLIVVGRGSHLHSGDQDSLNLGNLGVSTDDIVLLPVCKRCIRSEGAQCGTPACIFWSHPVPDLKHSELAQAELEADER
jgi:flagellar hook assembly protein FlgD